MELINRIWKTSILGVVTLFSPIPVYSSEVPDPISVTGTVERIVGKLIWLNTSDNVTTVLRMNSAQHALSLGDNIIVVCVPEGDICAVESFQQT